MVTSSKSVTDADLEISHRMRARRLLLGMSQDNLAKKIGVRFQQVQKYESGLNRIGAGRLGQIARALGVTVSYFYDEPEVPEEANGDGDTSLTKILGLIDGPETLRLLQAFRLVEGQRRLAVVNLVETLPRCKLVRAEQQQQVEQQQVEDEQVEQQHEPPHDDHQGGDQQGGAEQ